MSTRLTKRIVPEESGHSIIADAMSKASGYDHGLSSISSSNTARAEVFLEAAERAMDEGYLKTASLLISNATYEYNAYAIDLQRDNRSSMTSYDIAAREHVIDVTYKVISILGNVARELDESLDPSIVIARALIHKAKGDFLEGLRSQESGVEHSMLAEYIERVRGELRAECQELQRS